MEGLKNEFLGHAGAEDWKRLLRVEGDCGQMQEVLLENGGK